MGWLLAIEAHIKNGVEFPVNLKMCFEGMEGHLIFLMILESEGLDAMIMNEADKYFKGVDCVCICDNYWLGTNKPCLVRLDFFQT